MAVRIFIGSSAESLHILKRVEAKLSTVGKCVPWTKAFDQNKSGLDSLITQTKLSDFSILIAMKDDITYRPERGDVKNVARDNVIFEFGLFLGSSGVNKAYLLAEEGIDLPSDLEGITVSKFTLEDDKYNSLDPVCDNLIQIIQQVNQKSGLGLLPSTALAIGYYNSFLRNVCEELHRNRIVYTGDTKMTVKNFVLNVVIPENLDDNGVNDFVLMYNIRNGLTEANTTSKSTTNRGYAFHFKIEPPEQSVDKEIDIQLFDVPTTLNTIVASLKIYLPSLQIGADQDLLDLENRELNNFASVLSFLISKNNLTKNNVKVLSNSRL